jgi:predicted amidohydrolase YtcJ
MPRLTAHKLFLAIAAVALSAGVAAAPAAATTHSQRSSADLIVTGARIYTADAKRSMAVALAVRDGKIIYVGTNAGAKGYMGGKTRLVPAHGRLVLPGLFDSHLHPSDIVDLDVCNLNSTAKSLKELTDFVRGCIEHYQVQEGEWLHVQQWNPFLGNEPDAEHATLRAALDLASTTHPIQLLGNDGHHGAYNSMALAMAKNAAGLRVGLSKATLGGDFRVFRKLVGVDVGGEPNGTVNEEARSTISTESMLSGNLKEVMKAPGRVTERLNSVGITGMMDAAAAPEILPLYDALDKSGKLTVRTTLALYFDPDEIKTADGKPDWERMVASAVQIRKQYAHNPLLRADTVKLFADGVLEGNPLATPPTAPEVASLKPYLQPIFTRDSAGHNRVSGYVDTATPLCAEVRAHADPYESGEAAAAFLKEHGYHPGQCEISSGQLQHERAVILEFVRRFHLAGFNIHIHAIGDMGVRTAVDAIEQARAADGIATQHDGLAHLQLVHPDDVARIGRDHLYLAYTYAWMFSEPRYDMSVIPFIDRVSGNDTDGLLPKDGYYESNAYPVRASKEAGAILVAGSDAPVETPDPRPFVNMQMAVMRSLPGLPVQNPSQRIPVRDVIDAYTINGAHYLNRDSEAGSIEVGKSADFIVLDRDILALADHGQAQQIGATQVLQTWFMGKQVYQRPAH